MASKAIKLTCLSSSLQKVIRREISRTRSLSSYSDLDIRHTVEDQLYDTRGVSDSFLQELVKTIQELKTSLDSYNIDITNIQSRDVEESKQLEIDLSDDLDSILKNRLRPSIRFNDRKAGQDIDVEIKDDAIVLHWYPELN